MPARFTASYVLPLAVLLVVLSACGAPEADRAETAASTDAAVRDTAQAPATGDSLRVADLLPATKVAEAPAFTVTTLDGETLSLAALRGRIVVLNLWATWCGPCRYEVPDLDAVQRALGPEVQVLGVAVNDDPDAVRAFAERAGVSYPIALDDGTIETLYGPTTVMPTTFVIDRDGTLAYVAFGMLDRETLEPVLRSMLDGAA